MIPEYQIIIKDFCKRLNYEIKDDFFKDSLWILTIQAGQSVLTIEKKKEFDFCIVFFTFKITDQKTIEILEKSDLNPQFIFGIKSSLFNQVTSTLFITENNHLRGFYVSKKIFLDDPSFTIKEFEETIIAVGGTGVFGVAYLNAFFGNHNLEQKIGEEFPKTSPDGMFF